MKGNIRSALGQATLGLTAQPIPANVNHNLQITAMNSRTSGIRVFLSVGIAMMVALGASGQTSSPAPTTTSPSAPSEAPPPKLPYGADEVLKLSRAQISEDVTLNYVKNSGTIYNLSPKDIVYLRNEGVSDKVINAMIDQRQNVPADVANQNALQAQAAVSANPPAPAAADPGAVQAAPIYVQTPPVFVQPTPVLVPQETDYVAPSTLYVIPYGPTVYPSYGFPSFYFGSRYGGVSTVYSIGGGYVGPRYYGHGRYGGGQRSSVYHFGRR
jgi:hypothetical protein